MLYDIIMKLQNFDIDLFLRDYWQKKPLLIRNALPDWQNPLSPDELAGLSCEEDIESRLIIQSADWSVAHGPLDQHDFVQLQGEIYTLLVQAVDHHIPEVSELLDQFRFIPNWRIDDIMVSYANNGGGVGPHYDQYDVFLVQGLGQRKWQIGQICDENTPLIAHDQLRLIKGFQTSEEWILEAGDMLYVPPFIAHNGVAQTEDCMTYSVGFRSPSHSEIISDYCDHMIENLRSDDRYVDSNAARPNNPGAITPQTIDDLHHMMRDQMNDKALFAQWFGQYSSTPKYGESNINQPAIDMDEHTQLIRNPSSRFTYIDSDDFTFFADGRAYVCNAAAANLARHICSYDPINIASDIWRDKEARAIIKSLFTRGCFFRPD